MMTIRNDKGQVLHLMPGQTVTTEQVAGWLSDDELPGAFSYPISFPLSENNDRFLNGAFRPGVRLASSETDGQLAVSVSLDGMLYRRALFAFRVQEGRGEGYLKLDSGEAYDALRDKKLASVVSERIELLPAGTSYLGPRMAEIARLSPGSFPLTYFPIRNEEFFEKDLAAPAVTGFIRQPYLNAWSRTAGQFIVDGTGQGNSPARGFAHVPQLYLTYVIERIFRSIGWRTSGDWLAQPETMRLVLLNLTATPAARRTSYQALTVDSGLLVPNVTVAEFLKAIRSRYGLVFTANSTTRTMSIRRFVDVIGQPTIDDWSRYQTGKWGLEYAEAKGFSVSDYREEADSLLKDPVTGKLPPQKPLVVGKGGSPISLKCGTASLLYSTNVSNVPGEGTWNWLVPAIRQAGNTVDADYVKSERYFDPKSETAEPPNEFGVRLLSYRGIVTDRQGYSYPLASPDVRDARQQVVASISTALTGRYGIWRRALQPYYMFRDRTRRLTANLLMPAADFSRIQLDAPIRMSIDDEGAVPLLIEKIQAELPSMDTVGSSGLVKVRLTALTLPANLGERLIDPPVVWVELLVEARPLERTSPVENAVDSRGNVVRLTYSLDEVRASLRVRVWADEDRRTPGSVLQPGGGEFDGLVLRIRKQLVTLPAEHGQAAITDSDGVQEWMILTTEQVLDTNAILYRRKQLLNYNDFPSRENYSVTYALEPGDGYNLL